ncbi:MAG TPA: O-antigen ligase family protein [Candidatus Binatia bacterium]|nr:O-antigen ligase family protein [Candidatus Binatia bacterium]
MVLEPPTWRAEWLIVGVTVVLATSALVSPLALPLAVSGVVFVLAAFRFNLLLPVVVFFLPVTPFLHWDFPIRDLSTLVRFSLFAGVVVYRATHQKNLRNWLWAGWLTRAILGYLVIATASAVFLNPLTLDAQRELMRLASYVCFYYVITDWCQSENNTRTLLKALMASTIAVAIFGLWQAFTGSYSALYDVLYPIQDEIAQIPAWEGRITSFLEHYNGLAGYINLVLPFCLAFAIGGTDPVLRVLSKWCLALAGIALLFTQSRGGLLAFVAILLIYVYLSARDRKTRLQRVALLLVVCLLAAAVAGFWFQRLGEIDDFTAVSRLAIWGGAFTVFSQSPLFGIGFGVLRALMGGLLDLPDGWTGDAHNLYLELLAETGLIGFMVFGVLIVLALRTALKQVRGTQNHFNKIIALAAFAAICGVLVHGTVDYLFHTTPQVTALFFLVLALLRAQVSSDETAFSRQVAR